MTPYVLRFQLDYLPPINSARNDHWRKRQRVHQEIRGLVGTLVYRQGAPAKPLERATVHCIRYSSRQPDADNLAESFKPVLDALKGLVIEDDNPDCIGQPEYEWRQAPRGQGCISVQVSEVSGEVSAADGTCPTCGGWVG